MPRTFWMTVLTLLLGLGGLSTAHADDGCVVVLCLAGNWKQIDQCVPPVKKALRDLALGRALPSCDMASSGSAGATGASNRMLSGQTCPAQYGVFVRDGDGRIVDRVCRVTGAITVSVDGVPWSVTYWNSSDSVTWFSDAAREGLGSGDNQYDSDLAAWRASDAFLEWTCVMLRDCPAADPSAPTGAGEGG